MFKCKTAFYWVILKNNKKKQKFKIYQWKINKQQNSS